MYIGIDVGGSHISLVLVDEQFRIVKKGFIQIKEEYKRLERESLNTAIINLVIAGINNLITEEEIISIGIGFPGFCDIVKKRVISTPNLDFDCNALIATIKDKFDIPLYIDSDANCATLAAMNIGALKNIENGAFVTVGTGIGGGLVINDALYRGRNYLAGEFGHMIIIKDGIECNCGHKGCWERYASLSALVSQCKEAGLEFETIEEIFKSNKAKEVIDKWLDYLSIGLANIFNTLDVDRIVIGGGLSENFDYVRRQLLEKVQTKLLSKDKLADMEESQMLNNAGAIGAAMLGCE